MVRRAILAALIAAAVVISLAPQTASSSVVTPAASSVAGVDPETPARTLHAAPGLPALVPTILVTRQLFEAQHLAIGQVVALSNDPSGRNPQLFRIAGQYEPV